MTLLCTVLEPISHHLLLQKQDTGVELKASEVHLLLAEKHFY